MRRADEDLRLRARARWEAARRKAKKLLLTYIPFVTPQYDMPEHLEALCRVFDRIQAGEQVFVCVEAPPRHAKSETVFHGVARYLEDYPDKLVAYCTYSGDFAKDQSRHARDIAARAGVLVGEERVVGERWDPAASVRFWQTSERGGFLAVGRKGAIMGKGPNLLLVDDPFADRAEAESPAISEVVWDWFTGTLFPRREPGCSVLIYHQRWNNQDLIARIRSQMEEPGYDGPKWEFITLPAITPDGQPLWAKRYSLAELALIRDQVTEYNWFSQYMQQPRPKGARLFHPAATYPPETPLIGARWVVAADPAATQNTSRDHSAVGVGAFIGRGDESKLLIRRVWQLRFEVPEVVDFLAALQLRYPNALLLVEAVGGFKAVPQMLRRINPYLKVVELFPPAEKFVRWQPAVAATNSGRILVPEREGYDDESWLLSIDWKISGKSHTPEDRSALVRELTKPWIAAYNAEMGRVTGVRDKEDDQADMTSHMWDAEPMVTVPAGAVQIARQTGLAGGGF